MWKPASTVTGKIIGTERLNNSVNGNPRYIIAVAVMGEAYTQHYTTSSDAACSYAVENYLPKPHRSILAPVVVLGLTRAGRVATITRV